MILVSINNEVRDLIQKELPDYEVEMVNSVPDFSSASGLIFIDQDIPDYEQFELERNSCYYILLNARTMPEPGIYSYIYFHGTSYYGLADRLSMFSELNSFMKQEYIPERKIDGILAYWGLRPRLHGYAIARDFILFLYRQGEKLSADTILMAYKGGDSDAFAPVIQMLRQYTEENGRHDRKAYTHAYTTMKRTFDDARKHSDLMKDSPWESVDEGESFYVCILKIYQELIENQG